MTRPPWRRPDRSDPLPTSAPSAPSRTIAPMRAADTATPRRRDRRARSLASALLPLLLSGCALLGGGRTVNVTSAEAGTTVRLAPGDVLAVTLPSGVGGDFVWAPVDLDEDVLSVDDDPELIVPLRSGRPDPWAQGLETHRFEAEAPGRTRLLLGPAGAVPVEGRLAGRSYSLDVVVK